MRVCINPSRRKRGSVFAMHTNGNAFFANVFPCISVICFVHKTSATVSTDATVGMDACLTSDHFAHRNRREANSTFDRGFAAILARSFYIIIVVHRRRMILINAAACGAHCFFGRWWQTFEIRLLLDARSAHPVRLVRIFSVPKQTPLAKLRLAIVAFLPVHITRWPMTRWARFSADANIAYTVAGDGDRNVL